MAETLVRDYIVEVENEEQFMNTILPFGKQIVLLGADCCGPCHYLKNKLIEQEERVTRALEEMGVNLPIHYLDIGISREVRNAYSLVGIPHLAGFVNGDKVGDIFGAGITIERNVIPAFRRWFEGR